jgi:hypothetical protein
MARKGYKEFVWKGNARRADIEDAIRKGIDMTTSAAVVPAKRETPVRTGIAQGSVRSEPARKEGARWVGRFGSWNVAYFIWLEIGARGRPGRHMLRRAADAEFPKVFENIKRALQW